MKSEEIDDLVASVCNEKWQKCAMIIAKSVDLMHDELSVDDCAASIGRLVNSGIIIIRGDVQKWRESEVKFNKRIEEF